MADNPQKQPHNNLDVNPGASSPGEKSPTPINESADSSTVEPIPRKATTGALRSNPATTRALPNKATTGALRSNPATTGALPNKATTGVLRSKPQSTPQPVPKKPTAPASTTRKIRTYKDDIAFAVRSQKASFTSVIAAEQKRRSRISPKTSGDVPGTERKANLKKIGIVVGSIVVFAIGVGIIGYFALFYEKKEVVIEQEIPSFFFTEEQKELNITGKNAREILQALGVLKNSTSLPLGQMVHLYLTETTIEEDSKVTRIISTEKFLSSVRAQVSAAFVRSLDPSFMIGIHVFNQNQPFIVFASNSYQHSFAGTLEWERTMYRDLFLFVKRKADPIRGFPIDPQTGKEIVVRENFEDRIIQNIDVRALLSEEGVIQFLYAFPNQQTLIITTNENTLAEIITRFNSVRVF